LRNEGGLEKKEIKDVYTSIWRGKEREKNMKFHLASFKKKMEARSYSQLRKSLLFNEESVFKK